MRITFAAFIVASWCISLTCADDVPIPDAQSDFFSNYCIGCHDEATAEGDLSLEVTQVNFRLAENLSSWSDVFARVEGGKMPPAGEQQPTEREKSQLLEWLDQQLIAHSPVGGAPMRRLNRREFQQTIRSVFQIPGFELPDEFPADNESHGFDTVSEALVISPSHVEAYRETATAVADYFFPPPRKIPPKSRKRFQVQDFAISYSSAAIVDGAMRIASRGSLVRNGTWLSRFEAPVSGIYKITALASFKRASSEQVAKLELLAKPLGSKTASRSLGVFPIDSPEPVTMEADVELHRGETVAFTYQNAPLSYEDSASLSKLMKDLFNDVPSLAAAWQQLSGAERGVARGGNGWEQLKQAMAVKLDAKLSEDSVEALVKKAAKDRVSTGETIVYRFFEQGPNVGVHGASIEGPFTLVEDEAFRRQNQVRTRFLGKNFGGEEPVLRSFFKNYLRRVFRRPVSGADVDAYVAIVRTEQQKGYSLDQGMHLAIRTSLLSPHFLFKERGTTKKLSSYELAARLSYFLTSDAPDFKLMTQAGNGTLSNPEQLANETRRLLKVGSQRFAEHFTSQWLDTRLLDTLMPDPKLLSSYDSRYRDSIKEEAIRTFQTILTENRSLGDFINPDFLFTNETIGWEIYQLQQFEPVSKKRKKGKLAPLQRISIPKGTRHGGVLGMAAVMLATANGVDTQPVLRGVWMLENIIGMPPPEPPNSVPALSPDLSGATTLRQRLAAHMADPSCASCHQDIDPIGFVLENYDAVGRWRTSYPSRKKGDPAMVVDATGSLPDGTVLKDVTDLKQWLEDHPERFANCFAEKLMIYATGRALNHGEKRIVEGIVQDNLRNGNRFQDLIVALVQSDVFQHQ